MSIIRLFTAGTHNGLTFTNKDIDMIAVSTADKGDDKIPFVLGHPSKNLPIMGFIANDKLKKYTEGEKVSIGFDKDDADMSEESMQALRELGSNKLSIRLREGVIKHIGLVTKAAVLENNTQDFEVFTGCFAASDDLFSKSLKTQIKNILKPQKNMEEAETDFSLLTSAIKENTQAVASMVEVIAARSAAAEKKEITSDFSGADFSHLTDNQRQECVDFSVKLASEEREKYINLVKSLNRKPSIPANGSRTSDFGSDKKNAESIEDIVNKQVNILK